MIKQKHRYLDGLLLILLVLLISTFPVHAGEEGTVRVSFLSDGSPVENAPISLIRAASLKNGNFVWLSWAEDSGALLDVSTTDASTTTAATLSEYAMGKHLEEAISANTGSDGAIQFSAAEGLYLIYGAAVDAGDHTRITPCPEFVIVREGEEISLTLKQVREPIYSEITVKKVWEGVSRYPLSIKISLHVEGEEDREETLSAENGWEAHFSVQEGAAYSVTEQIPTGYRNTIIQYDGVVTITNYRNHTSHKNGGSGSSGSETVESKPQDTDRKPDVFPLETQSGEENRDSSASTDIEAKIFQTGLDYRLVCLLASVGCMLLLLSGILKNGRGNRVMLVLGGILIGGCAILTGTDYIDNARAEKRSEEVLFVYTEIQPETSENMESQKEEIVLEEMPVRVVDGREYVGTITIPSLNLTLPVAKTMDAASLKLSPALYSGNLYTDDMVIGGHNYKKHFSGIRGLAKGDAVEFTDAEGRSFSYTVTTNEVIGPYEDEYLRTGGGDLTLFTCTQGGTKRAIIRCKRENG